MKRRNKWLIGGCIALAALVVVLWVRPRSVVNVAATSPSNAAPAPEEAAPPAGHVQLTAAQVDNGGIAVEPAEARSLALEYKLFGMIQEDPGAAFVVRSEAPGVIKAVAGRAWPDLGDHLADGAVIGILEPRALPSDQLAIAAQRISLQTQLASAQADVNGAESSFQAANSAYERLKALNAQDKNVSDRVVEEALTRLKTEEARLAGAKQSLQLGSAALKTLDLNLAAIPLKVQRSGEVVSISAHPGEAVESGQEILRVTLFDHVMVAVNIPMASNIDATIKEARIVPMGMAGKPLQAVRLGTAALIDPRTKDQIILFRAPTGDSPLRPGMPVTAYLQASGAPRQGFSIPNAAVVRYQGKAWIYEPATQEHGFDRREISLDQPLPDGSGWFVMEGIKVGDKVVVKGAGTLLSHELNAFGGE